MKPYIEMNMHELAESLREQMLAAKLDGPAPQFVLGLLVGMAERLLWTAKAQHEAMDILFAERIHNEKDFFPTKHRTWPVVQRANESITIAEKGQPE